MYIELTDIKHNMEETFTYDDMDRLTEVKMGSDSLVYTYGHGHQRIAIEEHVGNTVRTKRYVGACERVTETMGSLTTDRWLTYLSGPFGVFAVVERRQGVNTLHYILKDHLGSWTTVTDSDGTVEQRLSYDAWGNLRDPNTWSGSFTGTPMFDRGFTGHEHLYNFGLINMNGRMYDPMMSSFLSVDRYVQDPTSAQGFNRYSYCMYNPLRYVDPTGWLPQPTPRRNPTSDDYYRDIYAYVERPYETRDFRNPYYECNMSFYGNMGGMSGGASSGGTYYGSYGYHTAYCSNSVYNYHFLSTMIALIRNWQNNPSRRAGQELLDAGINNLTVGELYGELNGQSGYRNSYYTWTDTNGNTNTAEALYEYVGGNASGVRAVSNQPLWMYGGSELFFNSSNSFRYDGHWRSTPMVHSMQGGQHVRVVVTNNNTLGVALTLQDQSTYYYGGFFKGKQYGGDNYAFSLMPFQSKSFDFYHFGEFPYQWQFELDTQISNAANVSVLFYSDWVPGMPPSRDEKIKYYVPNNYKP